MVHGCTRTKMRRENAYVYWGFAGPEILSLGYK
jgi:hypothetical protein